MKVKNIKRHLIVGLVLPLLVFSCANPNQYRGDVYTGDQAKQTREVRYGHIIDVKPVKIQAQDSSIIGTVSGGAIGAIAGSTIGRGRGRDLASVAGGIAGAVIGSKIEQQVNLIDASELTIGLDNGQTFVVVQKHNPAYRNGLRVKVVGNDNSLNVTPVY